MNDTRRQAPVDRRPPAADDNRPKLAVAALAAATVLVVMSTFFWMMASVDEPLRDALPADEITAEPTPEPAPEPTPTPTPTPEPEPVVAPPPPDGNELFFDEWLLSPYAILRENGDLLVTGTLQNRSAQARSAVVRVFVYADNVFLAVGTGEVRNMPGNSSLEVAFPSGTPWKPGNKTLLVQTEPLP